MPASAPAAPRPRRRFLVLYGVLLPLAFAAAAAALRASGLDAELTRAAFDARSGHFLVGTDGWPELVGHRIGRSLVLAGWLLLLAGAIAARWVPALASHRRLLWTTVLAMALGPTVVTLLKDINTHACPWNLQDFGGSGADGAEWFVDRASAGRCFPGGHAAGGFCLAALAFAGEVAGHGGLRRWGLAAGLAVGAAFSGLRVAQGAHFMSHNLWSAAVVLGAAAIVFSPWFVFRREPATAGRSPR